LTILTLFFAVVILFTVLIDKNVAGYIKQQLTTKKKPLLDDRISSQSNKATCFSANQLELLGEN